MASAPLRCIVPDCGEVADGYFIVGEKRWPLCGYCIKRCRNWFAEMDNKKKWAEDGRRLKR